MNEDRSRGAFRRLMLWVVQARVGAFVGAALLGVGVAQFQSTDRVVLDRWSANFFVVLCVGATLFIGAFVWMARRSDRREPTGVGIVADAGFVGLGMAYLLNSLTNPGSAAEVFHANVFGSPLPIPATLSWISAVCLTVALVWFGMRRVPAPWTNVALLASAIVTVVVVLEGAVRLVSILRPETKGFPTYAGRMWHHRYSVLNSEGFRDVEHRLTPSPGRKRVLIVGDSFGFGLGVNNPNDRLGEQLAKDLSRRDGVPWEAVTTARIDSDTRDELAYLETGLRYAPNVVVLVYVFNDIDYLRSVTPRSTVADAPATLIDRLHPLRVAFRNSFLFQEMYVRWRLVTLARDEGLGPDPYATAGVVAEHLKDIQEFVRRAEEGGASVFVAPFDPSVVDSDAAAARYEAFVQRAEGVGLPVIPLTNAFVGYSFDALTVNHLDRHPNALAHQRAAAIIAEAIADRI